MAAARLTRMSDMSDDVRLRDVAETDLVRFFEQEHDVEALRRSRFTPRPREAFMAHWTSSILGDSTVFVQTVTVDDEPAGHVVAWWEGPRRFIALLARTPVLGSGRGHRRPHPLPPLVGDPPPHPGR